MYLLKYTIKNLHQHTLLFYAFFCGMITALIVTAMTSSPAWLLVWLVVWLAIWAMGSVWGVFLRASFGWGFLLGYVYILLSFHFTAINTVSLVVPQNSHYMIEKISLSGDMVILADLDGKNRYLKRAVGCSHHHVSTFVRISDANQRKQVVFCPGHWQALKQSLRNKVLGFIQTILNTDNIEVHAWVYATLFGDRKALTINHQALLRHLGIVHLASASGLHLALLLLCIKLVIWVVRFLYRQLCHVFSIPITITPFVAKGMGFVVECSLLWLWLYLVSFRPSAVRAFACYLAFFLLKASFLKLPKNLTTQLMMCFSIFMLLSPLDVVSFASVLSWSSYLLMIFFFRAFNSDSFSILSGKRLRVFGILKLASQLFLLQLVLMWISFLLIGEISWLAIFGNLVLAPLLIMILKGYLLMLTSLAVWGFVALPFGGVRMESIQAMMKGLSLPLDSLFFYVSEMVERLFYVKPLMIHIHGMSASWRLMMEAMSLGVFFVIFVWSCQREEG